MSNISSDYNPGPELIRAIRDQTEAMGRHSNTLTAATYVLAAATIILAVATVWPQFLRCLFS